VSTFFLSFCQQNHTQTFISSTHNAFTTSLFFFTLFTSLLLTINTAFPPHDFRSSIVIRDFRYIRSSHPSTFPRWIPLTTSPTKLVRFAPLPTTCSSARTASLSVTVGPQLLHHNYPSFPLLKIIISHPPHFVADVDDVADITDQD
jgi:hypothetical protein